MRTLLIASTVALLLASCSDDDPPADVAGSYTINVTNRDNDCMLMDWTEGETASGIPLVITQDGSEITAEVGGLAGGWYDLVVGERTFEGDVSGNHLFMTIHGTRSYTDGECAGTITVEADANLVGDAIEGDIFYSFDTNGAPACGYRETCRNRQQFNGTRPPTE